MNPIIVCLALAAAICWGLAKLVQPGAGRVLNLIAVLFLTAALAVHGIGIITAAAGS